MGDIHITPNDIGRLAQIVTADHQGAAYRAAYRAAMRWVRGEED